MNDSSTEGLKAEAIEALRRAYPKASRYIAEEPIPSAELGEGIECIEGIIYVYAMDGRKLVAQAYAYSLGPPIVLRIRYSTVEHGDSAGT